MVRLGISVLAVYELPGARKGYAGKKTGLSHIEIVIPTKVGIQIGRGLWIPVFTGMTVSQSLAICGSPVAKGGKLILVPYWELPAAASGGRNFPRACRTTPYSSAASTRAAAATAVVTSQG